MREPVFSIVMPAYNVEATIAESIESVLAQSFGDYELIIVNDCSRDGTASVIDGYARQDNRILHVDLQDNNGVAHARNTALELARGRYMAFLDADDIWLADKLEIQYKHLSDGCDLVYSSYIMFWPDRTEKLIIPPANASYHELLNGNFIGNLTGAYDSKSLGKFKQKRIGHEDYLMWLEISKKSKKSLGIKTPLARYRVGASSISSNKLKSAKWVWNIYRNHLNLGLAPSIFHFIKYARNASKKRIMRR